VTKSKSLLQNLIKINIGVIKGVIKVLANSSFMFRRATYINQVFNVNCAQLHFYL